MNRKIKFPFRSGFILLAFVLLLTLQACGGGGNDVAKCLESGDCTSTIEVIAVAGDLPLNPEDDFWITGKGGSQSLIELGPQMITNPKWPNPSIHEVKVQVVRNKTEIAIRLEWDDSSMDHQFGHSSNYSDQAAVMFPLQVDSEPPPIMMGEEGETVNVWQWKAIWQKGLAPAKRQRGFPDQGAGSPAEDRASPVEDLNAQGFSTLSIQEEQSVLGKGIWKDKKWQVVLKRSLVNSDDNDIQFKHSVPMAIAVWNGGNRERNGQKGLAGWILLKFV
jgi:hypothetical protein